MAVAVFPHRTARRERGIFEQRRKKRCRREIIVITDRRGFEQVRIKNHIVGLGIILERTPREPPAHIFLQVKQGDACDDDRASHRPFLRGAPALT